MKHATNTLNAIARTVTIAVVSLACCACVNSRSATHLNSPNNDAFHTITPEIDAIATNGAAAPDLEQHRTDEIGVVRLTRRKSDQQQRPIAHRDRGDSETSKLDGPVQTVSYETSAADTAVPGEPFTIDQCSPEPRWAAPSTNPFAAGMLGSQCESTVLLENFPDEYLCDGGDRDSPVHYDKYVRFGLDTEDTIAEFTDHKGKSRISPSNRVCVYAPRFSSVRTVSGPHEDSNLHKIADVDHSSGSNLMRTRLRPAMHMKNEMSERILVRSRAGGLESEQLHDDVSETKRLAVHDKLLNIYQDLSFVQIGAARHSDAARLRFGIQAGLAWSHAEYPIIAAKLDSAMAGVYEAHAATIVGIDDKKSDEPGHLRIVKLADKNTAASGDVIEFTLRFDNLGRNPVHGVRIVDNLTPRLSYLEDSATCTHKGQLVVEDNGEGSVVLIWELAEPLPPNTGGVVTFKVNVR